MATTLSIVDYMGQALINGTPGTTDPAKDYMGRNVAAGNKDYMGRALTAP
jgi:hypothetical protein